MENMQEKRAVVIDTPYRLMQVYNAINEDRNTLVFVFNGVRFWRQEYVFMVEREGQSVPVGDVFDFETFKHLVSRFDPPAAGEEKEARDDAA